MDEPARPGAAGARALEALCLEVLRSAGAAIEPAPCGGRAAYRVTLPDTLAWHWGRPGRPCPELWLGFDGAEADADAPGQGGGESLPGPAPEPVDACSRRFWEIRALALDLGWTGIWHQPARRHAPALWLWLEAGADPGQPGRVPPGGPVVAWVDLEGARPPAAHVLGPDAGRAAPAPPPRRPGHSAALAVRWGPPPGRPRPRPGRLRLAQALEQAALACAQACAAAWGLQPGVRSRGEPPGQPQPQGRTEPLLRLSVTLAALIYVDPDRPWPPPPRLLPLLPPRQASAPSAPAGPSAAPPGPGAAAGP